MRGSRGIYSNCFRGARYNGTTLEFDTWTVNVQYSTVERPDLELDELMIAYSVALNKVQFWLNEFVSDVVLIPHNIDFSQFLLASPENNNILLPDIPSDEVFVMVLYSKIRVLTENVLKIEQVTLQSEAISTTMIFDTTMELDLPSQYEFIGPDAVFDLPWWMRNDIDTMDYVVPESYSKEEAQEKINTSIVLDTFTNTMRSTLNGAIDDEVSETEIVSMDTLRWTPTDE